MTVRSAPAGGAYYLEIIAWGEGNNRIFNNVFFGEGKRGGISLNSIDNRVYNNTFVGSTYAVGFHKGKPGNRVVNNVVQDAARSFLAWPANALPQTLDYNLYYNAAARRGGNTTARPTRRSPTTRKPPARSIRSLSIRSWPVPPTPACGPAARPSTPAAP